MHKCNQCGSEWEGRHWVAVPVQCPRCHRTDWNQPKKNKERVNGEAGQAGSMREMPIKVQPQELRTQPSPRTERVSSTKTAPEDIPGVTRGFPEPVEDDVPEHDVEICQEPHCKACKAVYAARSKR